MKYRKILGLLAVAAAVLMSLAGTASATITSPPGTAYTGNIQMTSAFVEFETGSDVKCNQSVIEGSVSKGETTIPITKLSFSECGVDTFTILKTGDMFIASDGTVKFNGTEYTKIIHRTIFGFPVTTHCVLSMEGTAVGVLTEGEKSPEMHAATTRIPHTETDGGCTDAFITGDYTVVTPSGGITID